MATGNELAEALCLFAELKAKRPVIAAGIAALEEDAARAGGEDHLTPVDQAGLAKLRGTLAGIDRQICELRDILGDRMLPPDE